MSIKKPKKSLIRTVYLFRETSKLYYFRLKTKNSNQIILPKEKVQIIQIEEKPLGTVPVYKIQVPIDVYNEAIKKPFTAAKGS